ncbi:MAG TPA: hypothetical protein VD926_10910 [Acidimicrobiales bacterium]|nr:hypothetical protein [Acidimicrobiales bacterium]
MALRDRAAEAPPAPKPRGKAKRLAKVQSRSPRRYAITYDVNGPHIRLGFLWFLLVAGAMVIGKEAVAALYALTAALAGYQGARTWQPLGRRADPYLAAAIGGGIGLSALAGPSAVGVAVLAAVGASLVASMTSEEARQAPLVAVGYTLQCGLFAGLAAAAPTLAYRVDLGAAAALIVFVSVYEMGDYIVGSGSKNSVEGPLAGITAIAVFAFAAWVITFVPFQENSLLAFGALAAGLCPAGQLLASATLPRSDARAPAVRRLDSLYLLGPVWVVAIWSYLEII